MSDNKFGCRRDFDTGSGKASYYSLEALEQKVGGNIGRLPFSIRILLEQALRNYDDFQVLEEHVHTLANWDGSVQIRKFLTNRPESSCRTSQAYQLWWIWHHCVQRWQRWVATQK